MLTLVLLNLDISCFANSVDPDQLASEEANWWSQLILICTVCHSVYAFISTIWIKESDWLTIRSGRGILIYSAWQGLSANWHFEDKGQGRIRWVCVCVCVCGGGGVDSVEPPIDLKFHFSWEIFENLINLGYRIYPKYSYPLLVTVHFSSTSQFYYLRTCAGWVADSVNPDQMSHSTVSDLDLHCLLRPVFPTTVGRVNMLIWPNWTTLEIIERIFQKDMENRVATNISLITWIYKETGRQKCQTTVLTETKL